MSTLSTANISSKAANTPPVIKDVNGTECGTFCRAWVNFNGTGTVAIRDSFNVSSITDNGTGDYTVVFTTAMSSANYAVTFGGQSISASGWWRGLGSGYSNGNGFSASSYRFQTWNTSFNVADTEICTLAFFGG